MNQLFKTGVMQLTDDYQFFERTGVMLRDLIIGVLEGVARAVRVSREAFGASIEQIGREIRNGALMADEAFGRAKDDEKLLDDLYGDRQG